MVPTLSPEDWYRHNQFAHFFQTNTYQPTAPHPLPIPEPAVQPMKRRGRPPKVRPNPFHTPSEGSISTSTLPADDANPAPLSFQSADFIGQCWFIQCEEGRSDMDIVMMWCSDFDNFRSWQTKPKQQAGEKISLFLISHGHPKREGQ